MKKTAVAPANIAFIKYWGRKDESLRLPANNSISMNLSDVLTMTTVEFSEGLKKDFIIMEGRTLTLKEKERVGLHLDRIREMAGIKSFARVMTKNNFPVGTGIASSASGFAALTLSAVTAAGLRLGEKELSILARQGSGSACRSIPDGFVEWKGGASSESSYAFSLYPPDWWDLRDTIVLVDKSSKKVSSSDGHSFAGSSPFYKTRVEGMEKRIRKIKQALRVKTFDALGEIIEEETLNMHAVMITSAPSLVYWLPKTLELILWIREQRRQGLAAYFSIDAGPNVHLICEGKNEKRLVEKLKRAGFKNLIINRPSAGTRLIDTHLF